MLHKFCLTNPNKRALISGLVFSKWASKCNLIMDTFLELAPTDSRVR